MPAESDVQHAPGLSPFGNVSVDRASAGRPDSRPAMRGISAASSLELGLASVLLLALMLLSVLLGRGGILFTQRAWLDEFHTLFIAGVGTVGESVRALARGADFNPPLYPLVVRALGLVAGGLDLGGERMLALRVLSFSCVWLALVGLYVVLRRLFDRTTAFIAAFALFTHPLIVQHSFSARFYGPWLLLTVLFLIALLATRQLPSTLHRMAVAMTGAALCLIHYYGVLTWGLVLLAMVASPGELTIRSAFRTLAPALLGPIALAACVPLYLGQRASLSVASWIGPTTMLTIALYIALVFARLFLLAGVIRGIAALLPGGATERSKMNGTLVRDAGMRALLLLGLVPFALILFSLLVQPTLIDRYTIVGVVACAPILAAAIAHIPPLFRGGILALALANAILVVGARARGAVATEQERSSLVHAIESHREPGDVVAIDERYVLYPLARGSTAPGGVTMVFPVIPDSARRSNRNYDLVEQDAARIHARLYGFPDRRSIEELRQLDRLWLVTRHDTSKLAALWFPSHRATRVAPHLRLLRANREAAE